MTPKLCSQLPESTCVSFAVLKYQQMDGLNTALPFGVRKINAMRTLTTESLAVFIPFRVQEIHHENGVYYGQNVISKNMIIANRRYLLNGNSFILGVWSRKILYGERRNDKYYSHRPQCRCHYH